jgi:hypothetical protein
MSMIEINWNPKKKELRDFGIIALVASVILSLALYFLKHLSMPWILVIISAGFIIFISSLLSAKLTRIIYLGMILLTFPIGWVMSFIVLAIFYFLIITPVGLFFHLIGHDPLHRKFEPLVKSYWQKRQSPEKADRYFHQF